MLFSAPTGFMAPPLPGVFVAVSCSGTLELGSPFHVRAHSNYSVVVAFWTFVVCAIYTCPVIGVRCCKAWDIHPVFENMFFSFQILVLSYELFISLAFFSHYPGDRESHEVQLQLSNETIILCLQTLLDLFTSRVRPPWTLLGMPHIRKRRVGILNTRQGQVCMVAPPLLDVHSYFIQLDSHWILQDVMIFRSWPIPHKLCIVNHQGWSSLLHLFKLRRWFFY